MNEKEKYYPGLNYIRILASVGIVAMHVYILGKFSINTFISNIISTLSSFVELFFIMSGFSMCCGYYEEMKQGKITINDFYNRRYRKMVPLFIVIVVIETIFQWRFPESIYEGIANVSMMFGLMSNNSLNVASLGWTLGVIFVFYFMFPFYVFLIYDKRRAWISLIFTYILHFVCQNYFFESGQYQNIMLWMYEFIIGGIIYLYRNDLQRLFLNHKILHTFQVIIVLITCCYYVGWGGQSI